jgi:hypothetical protein
VNNLEKGSPQALDHVLYEMGMLLATSRTLRGRIGIPLTRSAYIESFVTHLRNLDEFFQGTGRDSDTMRPKDFIREFPMNYVAHPLIKRMHQEIAHLTYMRKQPHEPKGWPIAKALQPMVPWCLRFLGAVWNDETLMGYNDNRPRTLRLINSFDALNAGNMTEPSGDCISPEVASTSSTGSTVGSSDESLL